MPSSHPCLEVFVRCADAIRANKLIRRESKQDKEFHFQNWFKARLGETGLNFEVGGRNTYPDFRLVASTDGFEVKGLAYPGREANYDCNSQIPSGCHNGRAIFYIFGRYPAEPDGDSYPVLDLVVCHGDFLNADHEYVHKNKSVKGFGSLRRHYDSRPQDVRRSHTVWPNDRHGAQPNVDSSSRLSRGLPFPCRREARATGSANADCRIHVQFEDEHLEARVGGKPGSGHGAQLHCSSSQA